MHAAASATGCASAALVGLLLCPFLLAGRGSPTAAGAAPPEGGPAVAVAPGGGPWYVGGNLPPAALPYVPAGGYPDAYRDPAGECTTWAAFLWPGHRGQGVTWSGDAGDWQDNAAAQGYAESALPSLGAIAVWPRNYIAADPATRWGHVAVVVAVDATSFTVTEMNVVGAYRVDLRTIARPGGQAGFITVPADAFGGGGGR